jgi:DNA transposition AAA+ family ATPase
MQAASIQFGSPEWEAKQEAAALRQEWEAEQKAEALRQEEAAQRQERFRFEQVIDWIKTLRDGGISLDTIAVQSGIPKKELSNTLFSGQANADTRAALVAWKEEVGKAAENMEEKTVETPTMRKIIRAFEDARHPIGHADKGIALVFGASGTGKTEAARQYVRQNPKDRYVWPVVSVRCTGNEKTFGTLLSAIVDALRRDGLSEYAVQGHRTISVIRENVSRDGLIIFDEAHLLYPRRMDELRCFPDEFGIALAFIGNLTGYQKVLDAKIAQLTSRAIGTRVLIGLPTKEDIAALLDNWGMCGRAIRETAYKIGEQEGGLRALSRTVAIARRMAASVHTTIDSEIFEAAALQCGVIQP